MARLVLDDGTELALAETDAALRGHWVQCGREGCGHWTQVWLTQTPPVEPAETTTTHRMSDAVAEMERKQR